MCQRPVTKDILAKKQAQRGFQWAGPGENSKRQNQEPRNQRHILQASAIPDEQMEECCSPHFVSFQGMGCSSRGRKAEDEGTWPEMVEALLPRSYGQVLHLLGEPANKDQFQSGKN